MSDPKHVKAGSQAIDPFSVPPGTRLYYWRKVFEGVGKVWGCNTRESQDGFTPLVVEPSNCKFYLNRDVALAECKAYWRRVAGKLLKIIDEAH